MEIDDLAALLQAMMPSGNADGADAQAEPENEPREEQSGGFFDNIDFDMIMKLGELFSQMNKPDKNTKLLYALKPHLRPENRHKVDNAVKMMRMMSLIPFLKDSGLLNNLF